MVPLDSDFTSCDIIEYPKYKIYSQMFLKWGHSGLKDFLHRYKKKVLKVQNALLKKYRIFFFSWFDLPCKVWIGWAPGISV